MLFLVLSTAALAWTTVLTIFMLRDPRLLLRIARWSLSLYLAAAGVLAAEVLREGLLVADNAAYSFPTTSPSSSSSSAANSTAGAGTTPSSTNPLARAAAAAAISSAHWDVRAAWAVWFATAAWSALDARLLFPACLLPCWWLSHAEARALASLGLARLRWAGAAHSPLAWFLLGPPGGLGALLRARDLVEMAGERGLLPLLRPVWQAMDWLVGWDAGGGIAALEVLRAPRAAGWFGW
ncbi:hypothetical protein GGR56DRAFT_673538 [Xylariaceae sp. FL0804]|nr:hypothetical protein GGR56DRAFT_673538 [Xylariaceae sp. FL0804]